MKKFFTPLAAVLISLLFILITFEGLVRLISPQQTIQLDFHGIMRTDHRFGDRNRENVDTIVNTGEGPVRFVTDERGFRVSPQGLEVPGHPAISILALGDSFLLGLQVDNRATITGILKERLERSGVGPAEANNTGVIGWNPNHYYLQAREALARKSYDLGIVFLCVQNDCVAGQGAALKSTLPLRRHSLRWPRNLQWKEWVDSLLYPLNDFLEARSHLFLFAKSRLRLFLGRLGLTACYFPEIFLKKNEKSLCWQVTAKICSDIREEFTAKGIPVFFVLLPTKYQVHAEEFKAYMNMFDIDETGVDLELPNRMLKEAFESMALHLLDPLGHMRLKSASGIEMYGRVDPHLNEKGSAIIASFILPTVENTLHRRPKK